MVAALNCQQVAALLECDEGVVRERAQSGELPGVKFGRGWIFPAAALDQRLNEIALEEAEERRRGGRMRNVRALKMSLPKDPRLPDLSGLCD